MMTEHKKCLVIFPYLKTRDRFIIGGFEFRSTDDIADLPSDESDSIKNIVQMLYIQDDIRIKSATFAIAPITDNLKELPNVEVFEKIGLVIGYLYASPNNQLNNIFLHSINSSILIVKPKNVSRYLVFPEINSILPEHKDTLQYTPIGDTQGYEYIFNFQKYSWTTKLGRIYPPGSDVHMNKFQDLSRDIARATNERPDFKILTDLTETSDNGSTDNIFTALRWYNKSTWEDDEIDNSLVCLSIAFESLLELPSEEKKKRIADTISLILGRPPRLEEWAKQFYEIRSEIVHQGRSSKYYFMPDTNEIVLHLGNN